MTAYYNENDPFAAAWLRELIKENLIAPGEVDERSICDVTGADLRGFTQVHLFAGIGGWSYALRLARWPDNRPVGTGSCPCQPFSAAGKQQGTADKRHLWPDMRRIVAESDIATWFGEQVASRLGREWLAGVRTDLEALGHGVGCADLCAAGVGSPHIRQRLYWNAERLADAERDTGDAGWLADEPRESDGAPSARSRDEPGRRCDLSGLADANGGIASHGDVQRSRQHGFGAQDDRVGEWLGDADAARSQGRREHVREHADQRSAWASSEPVRLADAVPTGRSEWRTSAGQRPSPWRGVLIPCADGKARRAEPGIFPLAHGVPNRVGTLRGAGNAICPQIAATFIKACGF